MKDKIIEKINKWFRSKYEIKVDYSTMTLYIKEKGKRGYSTRHQTSDPALRCKTRCEK